MVKEDGFRCQPSRWPPKAASLINNRKIRNYFSYEVSGVSKNAQTITLGLTCLYLQGIKRLRNKWQRLNFDFRPLIIHPISRNRAKGQRSHPHPET
jgi:hypothetical protein